MSLSTKVVFPAPPPTTNELTPQQRAQLIRQAKKIEQLLGSTPYLVDTSVVSTGEHRNHALWYAFLTPFFRPYPHISALLPVY